CGKLLFL
ncbi:hypothetical protein V3C99_007582, partial [Haemonchus contortus]